MDVLDLKLEEQKRRRIVLFIHFCACRLSLTSFPRPEVVVKFLYKFANNILPNR